MNIKEGTIITFSKKISPNTIRKGIIASEFDGLHQILILPLTSFDIINVYEHEINVLDKIDVDNEQNKQN